MTSRTFTTPEEHLSRNMRREYRKEERDEYKRMKKMSNQTPVRHVRFEEQPIFISPRNDPRDSFQSTYVVGQPVISFSYVPKITQEIHVVHSTKTMTNSQDNITVPPELAARGINLASPNPRYLTNHIKCKVSGCNIIHSSHYCNVCEKFDVSHSESDCPIRYMRYY